MRHILDLRCTCEECNRKPWHMVTVACPCGWVGHVRLRYAQSFLPRDCPRCDGQGAAFVEPVKPPEPATADRAAAGP